VNVQNAVQLGKDCMQSYENILPQGFHDKIKSSVVNMATARKCTALGATTAFDTELIFNRTLGIMGSGEFDLQDLFTHELSPIPTPLFLDDGSMQASHCQIETQEFLWSSPFISLIAHT